MVSNYKRKSERRGWIDGQLQLAVDYVHSGKSIKISATKFGVPRTTLGRRLKNPSVMSVGFQKVFSHEQEQVLCDYVLDMEKRLMVLSSMELRQLAYNFAIKLGVTHPFKSETCLAGKDWLHSFMKRHELSNRKAQPISAARANGFNKYSVNEFFLLLKEVLEKYEISAVNIWNVDETSISIVPKSDTRVIAKRGRHQVGGKISAERGETVTAELCMSAAGAFMSPMLIFSRVKPNDLFFNDKPVGSWAVFRKSGWMETDVFTQWFIKFIEFSKASLENPVLLILDGHCSHVKNLEVAELGKEKGIIVLCFPPHCTHRMQPLDVGFMKPLNYYYAEEVNKFQRSRSQVQMKDVFGIFGKAWQKACKIDTAVNAFKTTGIWPCNDSVFNSYFSDTSDSTHNSDSCNASLYKETIDTIMSESTGSNKSNDRHSNSSSTSDVTTRNVHHVSSSITKPILETCSPVEPTMEVPLSHIKNFISFLQTAVDEHES
ncbi:tigger transposable element-derived protein 4-like [Copidosoma floridanum]|uniref:tigger transposable element-derived protein 4-like n=1 Tax=Copidosoma floridanum TaxID=29053 RepID=UPI0006C97F3A|nr:tigger transposable element-derived protein 4-like [Copidosoma floridanum]